MIYDLHARRIPETHKIEVRLTDEWKSIDELPVRLLSVYSLPQYNMSMKQITYTLHAIVEWSEATQAAKNMLKTLMSGIDILDNNTVIISQTETSFVARLIDSDVPVLIEVRELMLV